MAQDTVSPSPTSSSPLKWTDLIKHTVPFHTLPDGFELKTDIYLPKSLKPGSHPLIIAYHGGGMYSGARDGYEYQASWIPDWATQTNAIVLSPDYRLLPKASGKEIVDDTESLWNFVHTGLSSALAQFTTEHTVDTNQILVEGGSAGGFTAAHLAFNHPEAIRAAILVYPLVDGFQERSKLQGIALPPVDLVSRDEAVAWIANERKGEWTASRAAASGYLRLMAQDAELYGDAFGSDQFSPAERVKTADGFPKRVWVLHGQGDNVLAARYTTKFVGAIQQRDWPVDVRYTLVDDEPSEHGFDATWTVNDEKLTKNLKWIEEAWL